VVPPNQGGTTPVPRHPVALLSKGWRRTTSRECGDREVAPGARRNAASRGAGRTIALGWDIPVCPATTGRASAPSAHPTLNQPDVVWVDQLCRNRGRRATGPRGLNHVVAGATRLLHGRRIRG
jgi:hypothetical protein